MTVANFWLLIFVRLGVICIRTLTEVYIDPRYNVVDSSIFIVYNIFSLGMPYINTHTASWRHKRVVLRISLLSFVFTLLLLPLLELQRQNTCNELSLKAMLAHLVSNSSHVHQQKLADSTDMHASNLIFKCHSFSKVHALYT